LEAKVGTSQSIIFQQRLAKPSIFTWEGKEDPLLLGRTRACRHKVVLMAVVMGAIQEPAVEGVQTCAHPAAFCRAELSWLAVEEVQLVMV